MTSPSQKKKFGMWRVSEPSLYAEGESRPD